MTPQVLDVSAGSRMMWFTPDDERAVFCDIHQLQDELCDGRKLVIAPDVQCDFRSLPFTDGKFSLVVFDPPHLKDLGASSWTAIKYGALLPSWREDIAAGFAECFRVLKPNGVLVFKWNEDQIPTKEILELTPEKPLFGHRSGRRSKTQWIVFIKE